MMKKIMIFGAGGFVGRSIQEYLGKLSDYHVINVFHRHEAVNQGDSICIDITDKEEVNNIIADETPDQIVNLAGVNSLGIANQFPQKTIDINVKGTINILESIKDNRINSKVLVVGSSEEYAQSDYALSEQNSLNPRNIYGMTKLWQEMAAEWYYKEHGIKVICVRAFNHTGIHQSENAMVSSFCKQIAQIESGKKENTVYVGNLNVERDISDVRDVVRAYIMLLNSDIDFGIYNVCSGKRIKLCELLDTIISFSSKNIKVLPDAKRMRGNDIPVIFGNNEKIWNAVGWKPQIDLNTTLKEIFEHHLRMEKEKV